MNDLRIIVGIAGAIGVALALGLGLLLNDDDRPGLEVETATPESTVSDVEYVKLRAELEFERTARKSLEEENSRLRTELVALKRAASRGQTADSQPDQSAPSNDSTTEAYFDATDLRANGLREEEIEGIRQKFARAELAELKLSDEATRHGWFNKTRHVYELRQLRDELRASMSEEQYDWMLYAAGRDNRVKVSDMLPGSEAESAGFRRGDVILRYDGKRVHDSPELNSVTSQGLADRTVDVEILRGDTVISVRIPSGPLGARFGPLRVLPTE